jgi:DNA-binding PadR family transcriptional regulator
MTGINTRALDRALKRGSAELLLLSLLDARPRHGYELRQQVERELSSTSPMQR